MSSSEIWKTFSPGWELKKSNFSARKCDFVFSLKENFPQIEIIFSLSASENKFQNLWHKYFCLFRNVFSFLCFLFVSFWLPRESNATAETSERTFRPSALFQLSDSFLIIVSVNFRVTNETLNNSRFSWLIFLIRISLRRARAKNHLRENN